MVGDVESLQGLYVRGLGPPVVALAIASASVAATAWWSPAAAAVLAAGLCLAGVLVPTATWALSRAAARRQAPARAELTSELVELLRGAPELVAYGREAEAADRVRRADAELARLGRRDALAAGLSEALTIALAGLTVAGVLAVAVDAHANGTLDRVLVATLALLALASFDAVLPLSAAVRELATSVPAGERVLELTGTEPTIDDPAEPITLAEASGDGGARRSDRALSGRRPTRSSRASTSGSSPEGTSRS